VRLQLSARAAWGVTALIAVAAVGSDGRGQEPPGVRASARTSLYQDSDATTISTSLVEVDGITEGGVELGARYLVDVVSSASVDVVSQATGRIEDVRHEVGGYGGWRGDDVSVSGRYAYSRENDWQSHNAGLRGGLDLFGGDLRLGASLGAQQSTITRANAFGFERAQTAWLGAVSATVRATPRDALHAALSVSHVTGFQASPYRYLVIRGLPYLESYPEDRTRVALLLRHHRALGAGFALRSHVRFYGDTYGVLALTGGLELAVDRGPLDALVFVRGYAQRAADFYAPRYETQQPFLAFDKELSTFADVFAGGSIGWRFDDVGPFASLRVDARLAGFSFAFFDFPALSARYGLHAGLGVSAAIE